MFSKQVIREKQYYTNNSCHLIDQNGSNALGQLDQLDQWEHVHAFDLA
jgi:hypothetical protein